MAPRFRLPPAPPEPRPSPHDLARAAAIDDAQGDRHLHDALGRSWAQSPEAAAYHSAFSSFSAGQGPHPGDPLDHFKRWRAGPEARALVARIAQGESL